MKISYIVALTYPKTSYNVDEMYPMISNLVSFLNRSLCATLF